MIKKVLAIDFGASSGRAIIGTFDGEKISLTSLELGILRLLAAHPGDIISRERFLNELWGVSYYGTTRTLDTRMATLRRKLGDDGALIDTRRGVGYRYTPPEK